MGVLKSSGAGPPLPLMTSASLTMALSVTAEEGGVRAGRPFPLPLSDDESSGRRHRHREVKHHRLKNTFSVRRTLTWTRLNLQLIITQGLFTSARLGGF